MTQIFGNVLGLKLIVIFKIMSLTWMVICVELKVVIVTHMRWLHECLVISDWYILNFLVWRLSSLNVSTLGMIEMERLSILFSTSIARTRTNYILPLTIKPTINFDWASLFISILLSAQFEIFSFRQELISIELMMF